VLLFEEFRWQKADIISTIGGDFGVLAESVRNSLSNSGYTVINWIRDVEENPSQAVMRAKWKEAKAESRSKQASFSAHLS
jgi:hypothetical protein